MFTLYVVNLASLDIMTSKMCPIDQENLAGLGAYEMSKYFHILHENGAKLSKIFKLGTLYRFYFSEGLFFSNLLSIKKVSSLRLSTLHFPTLFYNG